MVLSLFGLETEAGQFLSLVFLVIFAWIVINLEFCVGVFLRAFRWRQQILLWFQIVIIVELDFSSAKPTLRNPFVQVLLSPKFALREGYERYLWEIRNRFVRGAGIGEQHRVLAIRVLEEIVDSILLHKATNKRQIGFPILY